MFGVFVAASAVLFQHDFFLVVELIFVAYVILAFADLANEREYDSLFFFGHMALYEKRGCNATAISFYNS